MNLYLYTKNSPLMYVDRDGMKAKQAVWEGIEYIGGAALDALDAIDWRNVQNNVGSGLQTAGIGIAAVATPACATTVQVTGGCAIVWLAWGGAPAILCTVPAVSAWASCGVAGAALWAAALGTWMKSEGDTGSYTIDFKSWKQYHWKGPETRAKESAKRESKNNSDSVQKIEWTKAVSDRDAFIQEALRIKNSWWLGPQNYNRINSPWHKYISE